MDLWQKSRYADSELERGLSLSASGMSQSEDDECLVFHKKKLSQVMVSDMITHHENVMKDRLSGESYPVPQTPPPPPPSSSLPSHRSIAKYEHGTVEDRADSRAQRQNQARTINKEDPMSHRIIEKRRRDRMNNCLADLSRLIPTEYMKKGRGRVEKTEIIEMAIKHMKYLQDRVSSSGTYQPTEVEKPPEQTKVLIVEQYKMGFFECMTETMQYLVEGHGYPPGHGLCLSLISHLQNHCTQIIKGKQVVREVVKDEFVMETNSFNMNAQMTADEDGDVSYEEAGQQKNLIISKSQSSISNSNEQISTDRCSISFTDSHSSNGSMYKFKTDIKQRFSAENGGGCGGGGGGVGADTPYYADDGKKRRGSVNRLTEYYDAQTKKRRRNESSSVADCAEDCRQEVPIFALHANGSYYIPLTVNRETISPSLDNALVENRSSVIVHPISISVNFQATGSQF